MLQVLLYVPNVIGYCRLLMFLVGLWFEPVLPELFVALYVSQILLDGVDGYLARKLNQCSLFGAWLDVAVDNVCRSMMWSLALPRLGSAVSSVEWAAFVCLHTRGDSWKSDFAVAPVWVTAVMRNGFYNPVGVLTILGIHVLPMLVYCEHRAGMRAALVGTLGLDDGMFDFALGAMIVGRSVCLCVELWCIYRHVVYLAKQR